MHTDPIADMLTRIRNGGRTRLPCVDIPLSKVNKELARMLHAEGLIASFEVLEQEGHGTLRVHLKYDNKGKHAITHVKRVSKPGLRVYKASREIPPIRSGLGVQIVSTSHGILTDRDARRRRVGGEVLCELW
jgi:small subunit ribosomal protein S8